MNAVKCIYNSERANRWWIIGCFAVLTWSVSAHGFHPATDTAGPLTLEIQGPAEVTEVGAPVQMHAVLQNRDDAPLEGRVRFGVIDQWTVEPAEAAFSVKGKGQATVDFAVTAGAGTYAALYPIHATAQCDSPGGKLAPHAVLIVETKVQNPPRAIPPIEFKPVGVPFNGGVNLQRLPVRRVVVAVFGQEPIVMPAGWSGVEPTTHCSVNPGESVTRGTARDALGMHPPYRDGRVGAVLTEYPLHLPAQGPVRVRFGIAIRDHHPQSGEAPSDGVTFRVRVLPVDAPAGEQGEVLYEKTADSKVWVDGEADLTRFVGRDIRLQLESHPGPKNNPNCDQSYWAEPMVVAGELPAPAPFPPATDTPSKLIGTLSMADGRCEVRIWPGNRGILDSTVGFVAGEQRLLFHGFDVRVQGDRLNERMSASTLLSVEGEPAEGGYRQRCKFAGTQGNFDLLAEVRIDSGALRVSFRLENTPPPQPWQVTRIEDVAAGPWNASVRAVYAGQGNVIVEPGAFSLPCDGHRLSTSYVGFDFGTMKLLQAVSVPPDHLQIDPAPRAYSLHVPGEQTLTFIPTYDLFAAARQWHDTNHLHPAGGVTKLAGRFAFDLWGGKYAELTRQLQRAFAYGLTDSVVVMHNWQRWGYDYRLPDIFPPNPSIGTTEEFRGLADACKQAGVLFAPHDNYIDYYPDAEGYSYRRISFHPDGAPIKAWFNSGPKAQSYRWHTADVWAPLQHNVQSIRAAFAPTAYFIDVWSSIGPYDDWSWDGQFENRADVCRTWGEAFAWIRNHLGDNAPQISESGHDLLIGWLDGSQANHLRVAPPEDAAKTRWMAWVLPYKDAERIPWFDAAYHDCFVQHGAGYPGRYEGGLDPKTHGVYSDDYICTEMLDGHPAMVSHPFGRDVVRKYWLSHDVVRALALRQMRSFEFAGNDIHRQHVAWEDAGDVWANRGESDWPVDGHTLPSFGFRAALKTAQGEVSAAIERQNNGTIEWASSPAGIYVNARPETNGTNALAACGEVSTTGACRIDVRDGDLRVMPLPDSQGFVVRIDWDKLRWKLPRPTAAEALNEQNQVAGEVQLAWHGSECELSCAPGVFAYRMKNNH